MLRSELGFMIVRKYWGQGFATEVARTLIDYGLNKLSLSTINAVTDIDNAASMHVLTKLGFRRTGTRTQFDKVRGVDIEAVEFALSAPHVSKS